MSNVLEVRELSFSYKPQQTILDNISLAVRRGDIMMLIGVNGCGKTTLLKSILGLLPVDKTAILVEGKPLDFYTPAGLAQKIAYVPQQSFQGACDYLVKEYLALGRTPYLGTFQSPAQEDYDYVVQCARECGIEHLLETPISHLSGGQYQLTTITRALVQKTGIIVMDEPFSALDLRNQVLLLKILLYLKEQGKTVLLSTHDPNHALAINCSVCGFADKKVAFCGKANDVLLQENIVSVYGEGIRLFKYSDEEYCVCLEPISAEKRESLQMDDSRKLKQL